MSVNWEICPVPLPNFGPWSHDWRLLERTEPYFASTSVNPTWQIRRETWYCTRCRLIEERTVEA